MHAKNKAKNTSSSPAESFHLLISAIKTGNTQAVAAILQPPTDIEALTSQGEYEAIRIAAENNHINIIKVICNLLEANSLAHKINIKAAIYAASYSGKLSIVSYMLKVYEPYLASFIKPIIAISLNIAVEFNRANIVYFYLTHKHLHSHITDETATQAYKISLTEITVSCAKLLTLELYRRQIKIKPITLEVIKTNSHKVSIFMEEKNIKKMVRFIRSVITIQDGKANTKLQKTLLIDIDRVPTKELLPHINILTHHSLLALNQATYISKYLLRICLNTSIILKATLGIPAEIALTIYSYLNYNDIKCNKTVNDIVKKYEAETQKQQTTTKKTTNIYRTMITHPCVAPAEIKKLYRNEASNYKFEHVPDALDQLVSQYP